MYFDFESDTSQATLSGHARHGSSNPGSRSAAATTAAALRNVAGANPTHRAIKSRDLKLTFRFDLTPRPGAVEPCARRLRASSSAYGFNARAIETA